MAKGTEGIADDLEGSPRTEMVAGTCEGQACGGFRGASRPAHVGHLYDEGPCQRRQGVKAMKAVWNELLAEVGAANGGTR